MSSTIPSQHPPVSDFTFYIATVILLPWLTWTTWKKLQPRNQHSMRSVAILVLGDIGRSPRMMYHAQSFAENGFMTDLIGYGGSKPIPSLERLPKVQIRYLPEPPKILASLPFVIAAPVKIIQQIASILLVLFQIKCPPEFILVQNPPSIPTLLLAQIVARLRGSKLIIDWHNLGYTILALKLGTNHPFVRLSMWLESTFGRSAYAHLFVTQAMCEFLEEKWDIQGLKIVLYDRPPQHFHRASAQEVHELFRRLQPALTAQNFLPGFLPKSAPPYSTTFTCTSQAGPSSTSNIQNLSNYQAKISSRVHTPVSEAIPVYTEIRMPSLRPDRPALLVSSTSWTPDEDFGILLDALGMYEVRARELASQNVDTKNTNEGMLPKLLVVLTGKGPLRNKYMTQVGRLQESWQWVRCISLWLEAEDYPILLGSADLGVCLHSSSSALDLPMKVVDMFGCGLPVCALKFSCIHELVKDGKNGLIFETAPQLAEQFESLFTSFPNSPRLETLSSGLSQASKKTIKPSHPYIPSHTEYVNDGESSRPWNTWEENWGRVIRPIILSDVNL